MAVLAFLRQSFLFLALIAVGGYFFYLYTTPCRPPIAYSIGALDERFKLSREELLSALTEAEAVWEGPAGENLFNAQESGGMPINLLYDSRQELTQQNNAIKETIDEAKETAAALKSQYDTANARYLAARAEYEEVLTEINRTRQYQSLERKRLALNALADQANMLGERYNRLVENVNGRVGVINQTAGREFEEGLYTATLFSARIDIYEYSDRQELVRVLAHELGHSLGLEHNQNENSIMYELNTSENIQPTAEDLAELTLRCGI